MKITDGNDNYFSVAETPSLQANILTGKTFFFLGSSVTCGAGAHGEGMGAFIAKRNNCVCLTEAVSSTTLADLNEKSYVRRFENYIASNEKTEHLDAFICQLSTNDRSLPTFGKIAEGKEFAMLDKTTTFGAIEYIIALCKQTWNCPIVFYTGSWFDASNYETMIQGLKSIAKKWDSTILDLFYDKEFNALPKELYDLYMLDPVHPKRAGYREWWVPAFENCLKTLLTE